MRPLFKLLLFLVVSTVITRLAAMVVSKQFEEGSEVSDEFRRVVVFDRLDFDSRAGGLRSGQVSVVMGGARIDLRNAVLDPDGARLLTESTMSDLMILVREDWNVSVNDVLVGGGQVEVNVTPPEDLPEDAPQLRIDAITRMGATVVRTDDSTL